MVVSKRKGVEVCLFLGMIFVVVVMNFFRYFEILFNLFSEDRLGLILLSELFILLIFDIFFSFFCLFKWNL